MSDKKKLPPSTGPYILVGKQQIQASELARAYKNLAFQNDEREKRAAELIIANTELAFQNEEKEKRASELILANKELIFQNKEKAQRALELVLANKELAFQNEEKEKRANELLLANKELEAFTFISSHDLQEPLRKIQALSNRIMTEELDMLSTSAKNYFERIQRSALHMQTLINDLLAYSRTNNVAQNFKKCDLRAIVEEVADNMSDEIIEKNALIEVQHSEIINIIPFQFRQLLQNLIGNSLKFYTPGQDPRIVITSSYIEFDPETPELFHLNRDHIHISISDNGIGFNSNYNDRIFEVFKRLNSKESFQGNGMGLTIARKIAENHKGAINGNSEPGQGATFNIYLPIHE